MKALEILKYYLVDDVITHILVGDVFTLYLRGGGVLFAQGLKSEDEVRIRTYLEGHYPSYNRAIDKQDVTITTVLTSLRQQLIVDVELSETGELTLSFEHGEHLIFPTDTCANIVDWQWTLAKTDEGPYRGGTIVGCYFAGEVKVFEELPI